MEKTKQAETAKPVVSARAEERVPVAGLKTTPIIIDEVRPELNCGRYAIKREVGDTLRVEATIFKEGHDKIAAVLKHRKQDETAWTETPMDLVNPGLDRWRAEIVLSENTRYFYTIEAWPDPFETWVDEIHKKAEAGQNIDVELAEGRHMVEEVAARAKTKTDADALVEIARSASGETSTAACLDLLTSDETRNLIARWPARDTATHYGKELEVFVDRVSARYAAWYEMFPRSQGTVEGQSATFKDCEQRLPEIRAMGFDVVYLVPIHPIGKTHRKGPNNTLAAGPGDPGSPYAIGSEEGGHDAVHPELGTLADFRAFVKAVHENGMEVALDFAIQCSPDHPWIKEHPDWFLFRPDGTIKYAENPPKKYQDIVNVNFHGGHQEELWNTLRDVILFWIDQGVKIFRVDNPHTKPVPFWEWLIRTVKDRHPEVIFLSEAFTRPPMLKTLAKVGFSQSYTYFTWRNFKDELTDYLTELAQTEDAEFLRPNFFANTPDILPTFLQEGGRPAFQIRLVLAATLSPLYGIYNNFELCENTAVPDREEYLNSEKYDYKVWDWDRPGNIKSYIAKVNRIRRHNPALHELDNLRFYRADHDHILFYGKQSEDGTNTILVAVNLDPFDAHEADIFFPIGDLSIADDQNFEVHELLSGEKHLWQGSSHRIRLDPRENPAMIFSVNPWEYVDYESPSF